MLLCSNMRRDKGAGFEHPIQTLRSQTTPILASAPIDRGTSAASHKYQVFLKPLHEEPLKSLENSH